MQQSLCWSVVVKKALSQTAKLVIYCSVGVSALTNGQELWVTTEGTGCWTEEAETAGWADTSIQMRVRSSAVYEELGVAPPR